MCIFHGVFQQVDDHALDPERAAVVHQVSGTREVDDDVLVAKIIDDRLQQFRKVECRGVLPVAFITEKNPAPR